MKEENNLYWIWLSSRFGIASKEFPSFAEKLSDPYDVYRLTEEEIEQLSISERLKQRLCDKSLTDAYSTLKYCRTHKISIIGYNDKRYPKRLRDIEDPPVLLYCMGRMPDMDRKLCVGIVGTRKMSEYGKQSAYKISYELGAANVCVVSGMALGVDGVSACGAINAGGETVAVLGCGIAITYPKEHQMLKKAIAANGAVISEYPLFERPYPNNFPKRNRIISGLCKGVLVVEGTKGSGALITASLAVAQGREVFALPGKVDESNSDGPNELIRNGANVALCATDIINHYDFVYHDTINFGRLARAKSKSDLSEKDLSRYGVCAKNQGVTKTERTIVMEEEPSLRNTLVSDKKEKIENPTVLSSETDIELLDEETKKLYRLLPDGSFSPDAVVSDDMPIHRVMTGLTVLEINGLVLSFPGGTYKKL